MKSNHQYNYKFVIDTHTLIWHMGGSDKLASSAQDTLRFIESGEKLGLIPTIVLAELVYIFEKERTEVSLAEVLTEIDSGDNYQIVNFDREQVELLPELSKVPEMHDRMIVAAAKVHKAGIITKDKEIRQSKLVKVIWN